LRKDTAGELIAVCGGNGNVVTRASGFSKPHSLAGTDAEAAFQVTSQGTGNGDGLSVDGAPLDEEDGHAYSNIFFILSRIPLPSTSSGSPLILAYSSNSSFC
jgi:hypothetical protein